MPCDTVKSCLKTGLAGVKRVDKNKFSCADTRKIENSLDIDSCLRSIKPDEARWDYMVNYSEHSYFVEVHPADTSQVSIVIKKLTWLKGFIGHCNGFYHTNQSFHWIATNANNIRKGSPQEKRLASSGIKGPKRKCLCGL